MPSPKEVYIERMTNLKDKTRGTPVFEPDPGKGKSPPKIGDIGYFHETGKFMSILNIFSSSTTAKCIKRRPGDSSTNSTEVQLAGIPAPSEYEGILDSITPLMEGQPYTSEGVTQINMQAGIGG